MHILGIETSCDETAAAVVTGGTIIRSSVVASQIDLHRQYGGVFPEMASRQHVLSIAPVVQQAIEQSGLAPQELAGIAVTYGPGLAGSLVVGVNYAKGLAFGYDLPLIGVNHIEAHIYGNWLRPAAETEEVSTPVFPSLALIVSGGHTMLILVRGHGDYEVLGQTLDDAAGEAFDKVARLLGLSYPGGPAIQSVAEQGNPRVFSLPRAWLRGTYDFSFSGLKTAVLHVVEQYGVDPHQWKQGVAARNGVAAAAISATRLLPVADLAASFQEAVVDVLVQKTKLAAEEHQVQQVILGGGVAANRMLRTEMTQSLDCPVLVPPPVLCTDNGAPIAAVGYYRLQAGERSSWDLDVVANLALS
ncbi:MAG: tRNA (adenosine(37)-N6)-threonylcarbamoyltransferase complex transferase subunit TsaD [Chloroflexi bacterium]|nr:tRNA (adenosine(37)-N6)-threonylcarbamoyltransferase complex transferase subunit TsaD [Chloroflexota bacterium]